MPRTKQKPSETEYQSAMKPLVDRYLAWLATPLSARTPATEAELALLLECDPLILRALRRDPAFIRQLGEVMQDALKDQIPDMVGKYMEGIKGGTATQVKDFLEAVGLLARPTSDDAPKIIIGIDPEML
ncbi:MAG: hypothetical protein WCD37_03590 [Chloroflexia bacterium]